MSLCRMPSSSSEDGTSALVTESDLSDSVSADSRTHFAGEEEPPTKRKRDKALKTAAERNRKSGRMRAAARASSSKSSSGQKVQQEETSLAQDVAKESDDGNIEQVSVSNCIPDTGHDSEVKHDNETGKSEQCLDRSASVESTEAPNEDCHVGSVASVSEHSPGCVTENGIIDKVDKTIHCESVRDSDSEVTGKKECSEEDCITASASKHSADDKESTGVKQDSCSTEVSDEGKSVHVSADSECSGRVAETTVLNANCSDSKSTEVEAGNTETDGKKDKVCKNHDKTHSTEVVGVSTQSNTCKDEDELDKPVEKLVSNGHAVCSAKKPRGRPRKANKKGRKKRVHSNVTNSASVTEVQETDYEPTKKLGRPSKKSKLAQLAVEACDSLPQSEDDIPLIELRRSTRANKGQRKLDQLVLEQPKKRNRAKDEEKERKRAAKEEKRRKREAELQEQAALKAKKVQNI